MSSPGRPMKLTPDLIQQIQRLLPSCPYLSPLAGLVGVAKSTLFRWVKRGLRAFKARKAQDPKEGVYARLWEAVKAGRARAERRAVRAIQKAFPKNWCAAAWYLE